MWVAFIRADTTPEDHPNRFYYRQYCRSSSRSYWYALPKQQKYIDGPTMEKLIEANGTAILASPHSPVFAAAFHTSTEAQHFLNGAQALVDLMSFIAPVVRKPVVETEEPIRFRNFYVCPQCKHEWDDDWSAMCDDDCPRCGLRHIQPIRSEDIEDATSPQDT